jgi:hypothetical protein
MRERMSVVTRRVTRSQWSQLESEYWRVLGMVHGIPLELGVYSLQVVMQGKGGGAPGGGCGRRATGARCSTGVEQMTSGYAEV